MCCAVLSRSVVSDSLQSHGLQPTRLLCPWNFPAFFLLLVFSFIMLLLEKMLDMILVLLTLSRVVLWHSEVKLLSRVRLFAIPWTVVYQASLSMGFSSPGDLPDSGIKLRFPALQADALPSEPPGKNHYSVPNGSYSTFHRYCFL